MSALPEAAGAVRLRQASSRSTTGIAADPAAPAGAGSRARHRPADGAALQGRAAQNRPVLAEPDQVLGRPADPQRWAMLYLGSVRPAVLPERDLVVVNTERRRGRSPGRGAARHRRHHAARRHLEPGQGAVVAQRLDAEVQRVVLGRNARRATASCGASRAATGSRRSNPPPCCWPAGAQAGDRDRAARELRPAAGALSRASSRPRHTTHALTRSPAYPSAYRNSTSRAIVGPNEGGCAYQRTRIGRDTDCPLESVAEFRFAGLLSARSPHRPLSPGGFSMAARRSYIIKAVVRHLFATVEECLTRVTHTGRGRVTSGGLHD